MKKSWNYKLMEILKEARLGHPKELHLFLNQYSPLAAANEDYSILLILRHFKVQFWKDERRVLNCHPIDEHYQWGITIATSSEDGGSQRNIYLPNELNYNSLKINDREIEIISDSEVKTTNLTEIQRKVDLFGKLTEENITASYKGLSNEYFEQKKAIAKAVKTKIIENKVLGTLNYDSKLEWYECNYSNDDISFDLRITYLNSKAFENLLKFVEEQIKSKFYVPILFEIEDEMIALKNNTWLGEDENSGEIEPQITKEQFRNRISITTIVFYDDSSSEIHCSDDDIFFGHTIIINININGTFKGVNIAG